MLQQCPLTSLCCSLSQWQCSKADECARHAAFGNARFCLHRFANMNNCVYDNAWACMLTASLEHLMRILKRHLVSKNTNSAIMLVWSVERRREGKNRGVKEKPLRRSLFALWLNVSKTLCCALHHLTRRSRCEQLTEILFLFEFQMQQCNRQQAQSHSQVALVRLPVGFVFSQPCYVWQVG